MLRGSSVGGRLRREEASQSEGRRAVRIGSRPGLRLAEAMTRYERGLVFRNFWGSVTSFLQLMRAGCV